MTNDVAVLLAGGLVMLGIPAGLTALAAVLFCKRLSHVAGVILAGIVLNYLSFAYMTINETQLKWGKIALTWACTVGLLSVIGYVIRRWSGGPPTWEGLMEWIERPGVAMWVFSILIAFSLSAGTNAGVGLGVTFALLFLAGIAISMTDRVVEAIDRLNKRPDEK